MEFEYGEDKNLNYVLGFSLLTRRLSTYLLEAPDYIILTEWLPNYFVLLEYHFIVSFCISSIAPASLCMNSSYTLFKKTKIANFFVSFRFYPYRKADIHTLKKLFFNV